MLPNIPGLQKQVQKMQDDMARLQTELDNARIEAASGGGMVKAVVNGKGEMLDLIIAPEVVDPARYRHVARFGDRRRARRHDQSRRRENRKNERRHAARFDGQLERNVLISGFSWQVSVVR